MHVTSFSFLVLMLRHSPSVMKRVSIRIDVLLLVGVVGILLAMFNAGKLVNEPIALPTHHHQHIPTDGRSLSDSHEVNPALGHGQMTSWSFAETKEHLKRYRGAETSDQSIASLDQKFDDALHELDRGLPHSHDRYIALRHYLMSKAVQHRVTTLQDPNTTEAMEFVRVDEKPSDVVYRVPAVPWDSKGVVSVEWKKFGLYTTFEHIAPRNTPHLRVAVEMSGHMRTFKKCYESTVKNLLEPNQALLFLVTYPDIGDKRFGIRVQERDDPVLIEQLQDMYGPHLAALYSLDVPTVTAYLNSLFPAWFHLKQWSWMIYQLFTMDVAHDIAMAHILGSQEQEHFQLSDPTMLRKVFRPFAARALWPKYDVMIRVRPDLYIMGPSVVIPFDETHHVFNFSCGGSSYEIAFDRTQVIRAPHHPNFEWYADKLSDHSAIGYAETMGPFMKMLSSVKLMSFSRQNNEVFKHGNTAERMWGQHADRMKLKLISSFGWHIMLRNAEKYANSTHVISKSERRREFTQKVFGVTDPSQVTCPDPSGKRNTLPPKPPKKRRKTPPS
jgi:hypothetical protein